MTKSKKAYNPDYQAHPVETVKEAAAYMLLGEEVMMAVEQGITPELAKELSEHLGASEQFWLNLQKNYDERLHDQE